MKKQKLIILFLFITFIFFGMSELKAETLNCKYYFNRLNNAAIGGYNIRYDFTFLVDSKTGFKPNYSVNCENKDKTEINLNYIIGESAPYNICDAVIGFNYGSDIMNKMNGLLVSGTNGYECPKNIGLGYGGVNLYQFGAEKTTENLIYNEYTCGDGKLATKGTCPQNEVCTGASRGFYCIPQTCGDNTLGTKGTCPDGKECTINGNSQNGGYYCVNKSGNSPANDETQCDPLIIKHEKSGGYFEIKYFKSGEKYEPTMTRCTDSTCASKTTSVGKFEFDEDTNTWKTSLNYVGAYNYELPNVSNCEEMPTIKDFTYDGNNMVMSYKNQNNISSDFIIKPGEKLSCSQIIGENGKTLVKIGILIVRIITPILLFTFTALEFMKAIPQQDEDAIIKAWKRFGTRGVITVIIMLLPTFLNIIGMLTGVFDNCDIW